jgi:hypothetical protein
VTTSPLLQEFLDDIDETLEAEGMMLIGHFVWILRGRERGLSDTQMHELSHEAYAVVRERHRTRLVWSAWPPDLVTATPADETAPLEFDLDPDAPVDTPVLVLVVAD